jgi:hypothetical protein
LFVLTEADKLSENKMRELAWMALAAEEKHAASNFTTFVRLCTGDEAGNPFVLEPLHLQWHKHVAWCWKHDLHAGIMAHWSSGKSAGLVVPLPAWLIGRNPNLRIKVVCSSTELARERVEAVKTIISSPIYKRVFPHIRAGTSWKANEFTVERTGNSTDQTLQAKSVFGKGVGKRADVLIFDDVVDQLNAAEPAQRKKVREFVSNTWMGRLTPQGKVLYIGTPWNTDDATYHLMKRSRWCFLVQKVNEEVTCLEQEVHGAPLDYPRE